MIRQAQTYLVGAMSGATLIAIAIVAFVMLVSVQVFRDWPIAALGGSDEPHISDSRATSAPTAEATTPVTAAKATASLSQDRARHASGPSSDPGSATQTQVSEAGQAPSAGPTATTSPVDHGSDGSQGSHQPSSSTQSPSSSSSSSGGSSTGSGGSKASAPSGQLTETVNSTVNQVDETVTGGALEKTGVTEVTEKVVNGVAGPESVVGKVVDGTVETVTGLLGGKK